MRTRIITPLLIPVVALTIWSCGNPAGETAKTDDIKPPVAEKVPHEFKETGGTRVDNYHWMRLTDAQKNADQKDEQTQKVLTYLNAENDYLKAKMQHTDSLQEKIFNEIIGRIKQTDESVPYKDNGYYYYTRFEEGKEYEIYCRRKGNMNAPEEVLLNVNDLAKGHDFYSMGDITISEDNTLMTYSEDTVSRRRYTLYVKDLRTGKLVGSPIANTDGYTIWANDNKTFFYTRKDSVTLLSRWVMKHKLNTDASKDVTVYEEKDNTFYLGIGKTKSDKFIMIQSSNTLVDDYQILDASKPDGAFKPFSPREKVHKYSIDHYKDRFYIVTNWDALNFRMMQAPDTKTPKENWKEVIAHRPDTLLEGIELFKDHLVVTERAKANRLIRVVDQRTGKKHYLDFGEPAYTSFPSINADFDTDVLRYGYSSLTTPTSTYDYNMNTREKTLLKQNEVVGGHDPSQYVTERLWAPSRDGIEIPMSIVYKKGIKKDGSNPTMLYAYGSYGSSMNPTFSISRLSLLDRGFVYAIAHIRGGEEMGRQWYEDGKMFKKKNTFNDFIDCAEYLIAEKYTTQEKLFASGGSAGGLLMGAVVNMRPDLFKGVIAKVPFVDVISTMMDETIPLTTGEFDEWGNPKNPESYMYMLEYSPYDQVKPQAYPNMLVTTGLHDSQVQYWEPAKWVAKLRELKTDNNTLLLRTNMETGHGGATGRFKVHRETAQEHAFVLDLAGITK